MVTTLQELQRDQRLWMQALLETLTQAPILPAVPPRTDREIIEAPIVTIEQAASSADRQTEQADHVTTSQRQANLEIDLGEAPHIQQFYGREKELAELKQWIIDDRCQVIAIVGMGGSGKTSLAVTLTDTIKHAFDYVCQKDHNFATSGA